MGLIEFIQQKLSSPIANISSSEIKVTLTLRKTFLTFPNRELWEKGVNDQFSGQTLII